MSNSLTVLKVSKATWVCVEPLVAHRRFLRELSLGEWRYNYD